METIVEVGCYIFCAYAKFTSLNACDGMSATTFYFPTMLFGVRDDSFLSCFWSERNQVSLATGIDVEVLLLYFHTTDDVL